MSNTKIKLILNVILIFYQSKKIYSTLKDISPELNHLVWIWLKLKRAIIKYLYLNNYYFEIPNNTLFFF